MEKFAVKKQTFFITCLSILSMIALSVGFLGFGSRSANTTIDSTYSSGKPGVIISRTAAAGISGATDTGSPSPIYSGNESGMISMGSRRGNDTRRIYNTANNVGSGYLVDFSAVTSSAQIGSVTNPVGSNYNFKQRGPENSNQGTALAYSTRAQISGNQTFGGKAGIRDALTSLQVWINIGGELQTGIQSGIVEGINFDFYFGVGSYAWVGSTISDENAGTETYLDLSYAQDKTPLATVNNYNYPRDRRLTAARQGTIHASSRNLHTVTNKRDSWGLQNNSVQDGSQWTRFQSYTVAINSDSPHLMGIADNGGFWLKLSAAGYAWTSAAGWSTAGAEADTAAVLEGVRLNANYKSVSYRSNNESMGTVSNTQKRYLSQSVLNHGATATPALNHYFTGWSGNAVSAGSSALSVVSKNRGDLPFGDHVVTADFAPIPVTGNSFTYDGEPKSPSIDLPAGNMLDGAVYSGTANDGSVFEDSVAPVLAGSYTLSANIVRGGEVVGRLESYAFTINRGDGAGNVELQGWTYGQEPNSPSVSGQNEAYGAPAFEYQFNQNGDWISAQPTLPGTHNVRAVFAQTDNYNAYTAVSSFTIDKILVGLPDFEIDNLTYTGFSQSPGEWALGTAIFTVSGDTSGINAGNYTAVITLKDPARYAWLDGGASERPVAWSIQKAPVAIPVADTLVFNGSFQNPGAWSAGASGQISEKNAGEYTAIVSLPDAQNYIWSDGLTELNRNIVWTITPFTITDAVVAFGEYDFTYNGFSQRPDILSVISGEMSFILDIDYRVSVENDIDAGTKTLVISFIGDYAGETSAIYTIKKALVTIPTGGSFTYDASEKSSGVAENDFYRIRTQASTVSATAAGNYSVSIQLKDSVNYMWADGSAAEAKLVSWFIAKANPDYTVPADLIVFLCGGLSGDILPEGWTWKDTEILAALGEAQFLAVFTPADSQNYHTAEVLLTVTVTTCDRHICEICEITCDLHICEICDRTCEKHTCGECGVTCDLHECLLCERVCEEHICEICDRTCEKHTCEECGVTCDLHECVLCERVCEEHICEICDRTCEKHTCGECGVTCDLHECILCERVCEEHICEICQKICDSTDCIECNPDPSVCPDCGQEECVCEIVEENKEGEGESKNPPLDNDGMPDGGCAGGTIAGVGGNMAGFGGIVGLTFLGMFIVSQFKKKRIAKRAL